MRDVRLFDHSDKGANLRSLQENSREGGARCWTPPPSDTAADRVSLERGVVKGSRPQRSQKSDRVG